MEGILGKESGNLSSGSIPVVATGEGKNLEGKNGIRETSQDREDGSQIAVEQF